VFTNPRNGVVITNNSLGAVYTNQMENPLASTNDYFLATSDNFTNKYNPDVNICAQCHNHRGAAWSDTSQPPHLSPQYNMLLGTVGALTNGLPPNAPGTHAHLEKQCVSCHMQTSNYVSQAQPAVAGHEFTFNSYQVCAKCHASAANAQADAAFVSLVVSMQIQNVAGALDNWGLTKATNSLKAKYGAASWEYTNPGDLSNITAGPTTAEQALIPDNIKRARFNLYLVENDGSHGIHNPYYALDLLDAASSFIGMAMSQ